MKTFFKRFLLSCFLLTAGLSYMAAQNYQHDFDQVVKKVDDLLWYEKVGDIAHIVRELIAQEYIVVSAEYRGSTGYGKATYDNIDYGGLENEDVYVSRNYMVENFDIVDANRIGRKEVRLQNIQPCSRCT